MKKLFAMLMALLMVGTVCGCTKTDTPNDDQNTGDDTQTSEETYEVTSNGYGGEMKVNVTFNGDDITKVEVTEHTEKDGVGTMAIEQLPAQIEEMDTAEVDAVSGATLTSDAIKDAVRQALELKYGSVDENLEGGYVADTMAEMALESALAGTEWPAFMYVEGADLEAVTGVTSDEIADHVFALPMMNVHATSFMILEAKDADALASITTKMDTYFANLEEQWSTYLPDQHELVKNRVVTTSGNYYVAAIAEGAQDLVDSMVAYLTTPAK